MQGVSGERTKTGAARKLRKFGKFKGGVSRGCGHSQEPQCHQSDLLSNALSAGAKKKCKLPPPRRSCGWHTIWPSVRPVASGDGGAGANITVKASIFFCLRHKIMPLLFGLRMA